MYSLIGQIADALCSVGFVNEREIVFISDCYNLSLCKKVLFVLSKACLKCSTNIMALKKNDGKNLTWNLVYKNKLF